MAWTRRLKRVCDLLFQYSASGDGGRTGESNESLIISNDGRITTMTTILQILAALPALIKTIMELMVAAEEAFGGNGTGAEKKATVLSSIESMVDNTDLWMKIKNLISAIINTVALFQFGSSGKDPAPKS